MVDLNNCKNHQSIYTCLSRGSIYEGTAIIQEFDDSKIRDGISDWLRQEFRELELLNEITRLQYLRKLPVSVDGVKRKQVIHRYREWKREDFVPQSIPVAIQWSKKQPWNNSEFEEEEVWRVIMDKADKKKDEQSAEAKNESKTKQRAQNNLGVFVTAKGTATLKTLSNDQKSAKKQKRSSKYKAESSSPSKSKKLRAAAQQLTVPQKQWDFE